MLFSYNRMQTLLKNMDQKFPIGKISIVGAPATGKTTLSKMIRGELINYKYNPTMGFSLGTLSDPKENPFKIWDFGGQKAFLAQQLSKYIHGSDLIFIVTDSTPKNVLATMEIIDHARNLIDDDLCEIVCLANKQDLKGHMTPDRVEELLKIKTYPMVAIDPSNKRLMIELISTLMRYTQKKIKILTEQGK
ncbi:hypothetical protein ES708_21593 [subsurface metagenome]